MDLEKLGIGDFVIGGATFVYFVSLFITWFSKDFAPGVGGGTISRSGLDLGFWALLPFLLYGGIVVMIVLDKLVDTVTIPDAPLPWVQIYLIAAGVGTLLVLLKLLLGEDALPFGFDGGLDDSLDRQLGLFVGLLASFGVVAGAALKLQEAGSPAGPGPGAPPPGAPPQPF